MKYLLALGLVGMAHAQCSNHNNNKEACCGTEGCGYQANGQCEGDPTFLSSPDNTCNSEPPCDPDHFGVGTIHVKTSGGCDGGARYYKVSGGSGETRQIAYCKDNNKDSDVFPEQPACQKDIPELLPQNCNEGSAYINQDTQTPDWKVTDLCQMKVSGGGPEPPTVQPHPCGGVTCPTGFTKRSSLPEVLDFPAKECCRPLKKGCMTQGKANYDQYAEIEGLCFDAFKTEEDKVAEVADKSTFLEKRDVHKQHAKEDFYKKVAEGKSKRQAIREARATMLDTDLSQKVKKRARGVVKIALAINSGEDSCELGASDDNCGSLDLAEDRTANETTILTTENVTGSWAVVVDGDIIIAKQTKRPFKVVQMQCWDGLDGSWGTAISYDMSNDTDVQTHTCHDRVFLLGSTQLACDTTTCPQGCGEDGLCPEESTDTNQALSSSCQALKESGDPNAYIEGQCCNNC